jgi:hypothetical protein
LEIIEAVPKLVFYKLGRGQPPIYTNLGRAEK